MSTKIKNLEDQLRRDEGEVLYAYQDHLGYWTIGIGILIDKRKGGGITKEESSYLFQSRLRKMKAELIQKLPWVDTLDEVRQGALLNMAFQMGVEGLLTFVNSLELVRKGEYAAAASNMLKSKWAEQTPNRAYRITQQIKNGEWK